MFTSKTTSTPKYIKSKAYGLIGTIALFTSLAFLMSPGVSADEVTPVNTSTNQLPPTEVGGLFLSSVVKRLKADSLPKDSVL